MKTIVVLSNDHAWTYNLRAELLTALVNKQFRVIIVVKYGPKVEELKKLGCEFVDVPIERHGTNPIKEMKLIRTYYRILKQIRPDAVLSFTIKPNLYGAFACRLLRIPCIANITGLGTAVEYPGFLQALSLMMYRLFFRKIYMVLFQNTANRDFFLKHNIVKNNYDLLPGSGVNIKKFIPLPYPQNNTVEFVFISRIMKEKGIEEYLNAARIIKDKHPYTNFHVCGFCEQNYEAQISELEKQGYIINHGMIDNITDVLKGSSCTILPTYYPEGMSNVLLESAASARPIITTNRPGCREIIDDGYNGFIISPRDSEGLINAIDRFLNLSREERKLMGLNGRRKVETQFDRQIVINKYLEIIDKL